MTRLSKMTLLATASLLLAGPALADTITLTATVDGTFVTTDSSLDGTLDISNQAFGPDFNLNSLDINSKQFLAAPNVLNTNALDVNQDVTGTHQLVLDIAANGLVGPGALSALISEFSVTGLTTGWTVMEQTFINGAALASTPVFSGNSAAEDVNGSALLTNPFSADVRYTITATGEGSFNGGINILAPVPGPVVGAGVPGILGFVSLLGLMWIRRRRRSEWGTPTRLMAA